MKTGITISFIVFVALLPGCYFFSEQETVITMIDGSVITCDKGIIFHETAIRCNDATHMSDISYADVSGINSK